MTKWRWILEKRRFLLKTDPITVNPSFSTQVSYIGRYPTFLEAYFKNQILQFFLFILAIILWHEFWEIGNEFPKTERVFFSKTTLSTKTSTNFVKSVMVKNILVHIWPLFFRRASGEFAAFLGKLDFKETFQRFGATFYSAWWFHGVV